jgi:hypothetical protein
MSKHELAWNEFYDHLRGLPNAPQHDAMLTFVTKAVSRFESLPAPRLHWSDTGASLILLWSKSHLEFVQVEFHPNSSYSVMVNNATLEPTIDIFAGFA